MPHSDFLKKRIFEISSPEEFNEVALQIFHFQYENNPVYRKFADNLPVNISDISHFSQIPFLPVEFFKDHKVMSGEFEPDIVFTSSGTTGSGTSRHFVKDRSLYEADFFKTFEFFFGKPQDCIMLALLPSYLERKGSSLVYMAEKLIARSKHPESGFYLHDYKKLANTLKKLRN
ncbi:MAG: acyl transferase, partial [Chlorobi bacterium]|nr:acyl transferase [Chlorobiota bacterium]